MPGPAESVRAVRRVVSVFVPALPGGTISRFNIDPTDQGKGETKCYARDRDNAALKQKHLGLAVGAGGRC
jgi:hypothetical protein